MLPGIAIAPGHSDTSFLLDRSEGMKKEFS